MTMPDPDIQRLVRTAMEQAQPSARTRMQSQSQLLTRLETPPVPPAFPEGSGEPAALPVAGAAGVAAKVAAAVVVAAGLTAVAIGRGDSERHIARGHDAAVVTPDPVATDSTPSPAPAVAPAAVSTRGRAVVVSTPPARPKRLRLSPPSAQPGSPAAAVGEAKAAPAPSLTEEASLVARADAALTRGEPRSARALLRAHKLRFPSGQLTRERDGLLRIAACQLHEPGARQSAQAFIERSGDAGPVDRVAEQCKGSSRVTDPSPEDDSGLQ